MSAFLNELQDLLDKFEESKKLETIIKKRCAQAAKKGLRKTDLWLTNPDEIGAICDKLGLPYTQRSGQRADGSPTNITVTTITW